MTERRLNLTRGSTTSTMMTFFETPVFHPLNQVAVGQNQWYHFWVGAPPILVGMLVGDWDVHWEYEILTHGQVTNLTY